MVGLQEYATGTLLPPAPFEAELRHEAGMLTADDGTRLFWQGLAPRGEHRAAVALVHGCNSFSDWLLPMMATLARSGLACYAIDARGHGLSEGVPQHVFTFQEYLSDVHALCRNVAERAGDGKVFVFGYSMGGLVVSLYGLLYPEHVLGTVLTAPFFGPAFRVPPLLDLCAQAVSVCHPTLKIPRRHPDLPERVTVRWWTETQAAQQVFRQQANEFTLPVLMLHGQRDAVACPRNARRLFERLGAEDKTFRLLPGAGHHDLDPCHGTDWWPLVRDWISERAPTG